MAAISAPWRSERWESPRRRASPRRRRQPSNNARASEQGEKEKGKGKGKQQTPKVPATRQLPKPPSAKEPPAPKEPALLAVSDAAEDSKLLEALIPHIRQDELPDAIRGLLKQKEQLNVKSDAKHLHRLVARRSEAKRHLSSIREERMAFEQSWSRYASDLMRTLQEQWEQREVTLSSLDKKEQEWAMQLAEATKELKLAAKDSEKGGEATDSDQMSDMETDRAAETDAKVEAKREELSSCHRKLQEALANVKAAADMGAVAGERERVQGFGKALALLCCQGTQGGWTSAFLNGLGTSLRGPLRHTAAHSVTHEADFVSELDAFRQAIALRGDVLCGTDTWVDPRVDDDLISNSDAAPSGDLRRIGGTDDSVYGGGDTVYSGSLLDPLADESDGPASRLVVSSELHCKVGLSSCFKKGAPLFRCRVAFQLRGVPCTDDAYRKLCREAWPHVAEFRDATAPFVHSFSFANRNLFLSEHTLGVQAPGIGSGAQTPGAGLGAQAAGAGFGAQASGTGSGAQVQGGQPPGTGLGAQAHGADLGAQAQGGQAQGTGLGAQVQVTGMCSAATGSHTQAQRTGLGVQAAAQVQGAVPDSLGGQAPGKDSGAQAPGAHAQAQRAGFAEAPGTGLGVQAPSEGQGAGFGAQLAGAAQAQGTSRRTHAPAAGLCAQAQGRSGAQASGASSGVHAPVTGPLPGRSRAGPSCEPAPVCQRLPVLPGRQHASLSALTKFAFGSDLGASSGVQARDAGGAGSGAQKGAQAQGTGLGASSGAQAQGTGSAVQAQGSGAHAHNADADAGSGVQARGFGAQAQSTGADAQAQASLGAQAPCRGSCPRTQDAARRTRSVHATSGAQAQGAGSVGLGAQAQGACSGAQAQGQGAPAQGAGPGARAQGPGAQAQGLGAQVQGAGSGAQAQGLGAQAQGAGSGAQAEGAGAQAQGLGAHAQGADSGAQAQGPGAQPQGAGSGAQAKGAGLGAQAEDAGLGAQAQGAGSGAQAEGAGAQAGGASLGAQAQGAGRAQAQGAGSGSCAQAEGAALGAQAQGASSGAQHPQGTGAQVQGTGLGASSGAQAQGAGVGAQGAGLAAQTQGDAFGTGSGAQAQGAGLGAQAQGAQAQGLGAQAQGAGSGAQAEGAGAQVGGASLGAQAQGAGPAQAQGAGSGSCAQAEGAGLGAQAQGASSGAQHPHTGAQVQGTGPGASSGAQAQGAGVRAQGAGLAAQTQGDAFGTGSGAQAQGAGLGAQAQGAQAQGLGAQAQGAGSGAQAEGAGAQAGGASLGAQAQGAGRGAQAQGAGSGSCAQAEGASSGAQAQGAGVGAQAQGTGLTAQTQGDGFGTGSGAQAQGAGLGAQAQGAGLGAQVPGISVQAPSLPLSEAISQHSETPDSLQRMRVDLKALASPWLGFWCPDFDAFPCKLRQKIFPSTVAEGPIVAFHIFTDGSATSGKAGWGVILCAEHAGYTSEQLHWVGFAAGPVGAPDSPFTSKTNNAAEACALLVATAFSLSAQHIPVWLHSDSRLAIGEAAGWSAPIQSGDDATSGQPDVHTCLRQLTLFRHACDPRLHHAWIRSHQGHLWNEMADRAADMGCRGVIASPVPTTLWRVVAHPLLPWAWCASPANDLPPLEQLCAGQYEQADTVSPSHIKAVLDDSQVPVHGPVHTCDLRVLTANLCTARGKLPALQQQADELNIHVAAFQETRLPATFCKGTWLRFHSAAAAGHEGCALWFRSSVPWVSGQLGSCVSHEHFSVLHSSPTCLAVSHSSPWCRALFTTFHAPHSLSPLEVREAWWNDFDHKLQRWARNWPIVLLGDANAKISIESQPHVGTVAVGAQDWAGERISQLCARFGLALLNTHAHILQGADPFTWRQSRLDYIAAPLAHFTQAKVVPEHGFDLLNHHDDHKALVMDISLFSKGSSAATPPRNTFRSLAPEAYAAVAASVCANSIPWQCDVHSHAETLLKAARNRLFHHQAEQKASPARKAYVSEAALQSLRARKTAKKQLVLAEKRCRTLQLKRAIARWHRPGRPVPPDLRPPKMDRWCVALWQHTVSLTILTVRLQLNMDRVAYATNIAQKLKEGTIDRDSKAVYRALRCLRPASKNVQKPWGPLPVVTDASGYTAQCFAEAQDIRAKHFGALEVADPLNARELAEMVQPTPKPSEPFDIKELPTLLMLETALRKLAPGKASGLSGVPNELWRANAPACARHWFPLLVKQQVRITEPVRFSTSMLLTLLKKGAEASISGHRAIYLFEGIGKVFRRLHRSALVEELNCLRPTCLQGSVPGSDSSQLTHYLCTLLRIAADTSTSLALLFVDTRAAFYRVIRQCLATQQLDDEALCQILARMQVKPTTVHTVLEWIQGKALTAGMSAHNQAIVNSWFAHAGFVARGQKVVHRTQVGTRPGDTVSDALFGFVMCDALVEIRERMHSEGLLSGPGEGPLVQPAWADDLCVPVHATRCSELRPRLIRACAIVHSAYVRRAMDPNYNRGKTEAICALHGEGAKCAKTRLLQDEHVVSVPDAHGPPVHLSVVHRYVHLGTTLDAQADPAPDLDRKAAQALSATRPLGRHVFRNSAIPLSGRWTLFQEVPLAMAVHNVGVWIPTAPALHAWESKICSALRYLLPEDRRTHHPAYPNMPELCGILRAYCPAALLLMQRMRLLVRIFRSDNQSLWDLLCTHARCSADTWLAQIQRDLAFAMEWAPALFDRPLLPALSTTC